MGDEVQIFVNGERIDMKDLQKSHESLRNNGVDVTDRMDGEAVKPEEYPEAEITDLIPLPPDGGWGWVVVFASFMNHFILDGICYAFGVLLKSYRDQFECSSAATGALMSTLIGCYLLSAPIVSAMVNRFGCRPVGMAGSLIAAAAFVVSTFVGSIDALIFVLGVIGGIGFGFMYLPAVVSVSMYFERKRAIALGIAMCGTGIGTFTFGPLGKWLLEILDWKNVHFILASCILQGVVFSALVRPVQTKLQMKQIQQEVATPELESAKPSGTLIHSQPIGRTENKSFGSINVIRSTAYLGTSQKIKTTTLSAEQADDLRRPMYKKDIFYSGSIYNLKEYQDTANMKDYVASIVTIPAMNEDQTKRCNIISCKCLPKTMSDIISEMLDFGLFTKAAFNIIFFAILVLMLAYFIPFAYINVRAVHKGIDEGNASFLISILGLSTMLGRLGACLLAQIPNLRSITLHNLFLFGAGLAVIFVPLCHTYITMAVTAFLYGLCMGGHVSLSPLVLVEILGLQRLTSSFGLMTLARGISTLAGPTIAGYLYDSTQSYDASFYMGGSLIIVSTVAFCILELPVFRKQAAKNQTESTTATK